MSLLVNEGRGAVSAADYPDFWEPDGVRLRVSYQFEPGTDADGVTVHIPLSQLNSVRGEDFSWQVPGLRKELVVALIRGLPKAVRRNFVPVPDFADAALAQLAPGAQPLPEALAWELYRISGVAIAREDWALDRLPEHLRMTFRVVADGDDNTLAEGKDLDALRHRLRAQTRAVVSAAAAGIEQQGLRAWTFGALPQRYERPPLTMYPALVDEGNSVAIRAFETPAEQRRAMWPGTRRLLLLTVAPPVKMVNARLSNEAKLVLSRNPHRSAADLLDDCVAAAVDALMSDAGGPAWTEDGFTALREAVRTRLPDALFQIVTEVRDILSAWYPVTQRLAAVPAGPALDDIRAQLSNLVYRGFVTATGWSHLPDLPRYLRAIERRLDKLAENPRRDAEQMRQIQQIEQEYRELLSRVPDGEAVREIRWMIEELRVSYFAQALGTAYPVSDKRIFRAMDEIDG
jgi:ATP-dependent helicase HrpA